MKRLKRSDIPDDEILEAIRMWQRLFSLGFHSQTPEESLAHKYPPKLILSKMERMVEKKILNYGVSLRTSWIEGERNFID